MTHPRLDDASRPRLPAGAAAGAATTETGRAGQQALQQIHDHLRAELRQVVDVVGQVVAGAADPAATRSMINRMTMRQNYWSVGAFCATYCRVVTLHHTIEDQRLFRDLRAHDDSLAPVLERLSEEHEVIAAMLDGLDRALVAMVDDPARVGEVSGVAAVLDEALRSHFAYEEEQLLGPIGQADILI